MLDIKKRRTHWTKTAPSAQVKRECLKKYERKRFMICRGIIFWIFNPNQNGYFFPFISHFSGQGFSIPSWRHLF